MSLFARLGFRTRADRQQLVSILLSRDVEHWAELTAVDVSRLLDCLVGAAWVAGADQISVPSRPVLCDVCATVGDEPWSGSQRRMLFASLHGLSDDRDHRLRWASLVLGRDVRTFAAFTRSDAGRMIDSAIGAHTVRTAHLQGIAA